MPSQNKLQIWRNTTNNTSSVLTSMPYWKIHSLFPSKFLPSTIRPLSLRLGKGLWHNQQQENVLTAPLIQQQKFIVIKQTLRAKLLLPAQATCSAWRTGHWKGHVPARPRIGSAERAQWFEVWDLETGRTGFESRIWVNKLFNILKLYMLSTLSGT